MPKRKITNKSLSPILEIYNSNDSVNKHAELCDELFKAIDNDDFYTIRKLVSKDININIIINGNTPLVYAAERSKNLIVKLLLSLGAKINSVNEFQTPILHIYAGANDLDMVKYLIAEGADINFQGYQGFTALMYAHQKEFNKISKLLIKKGADLSLTSDYGNSIIHNYVKNNDFKMLKHIFEKGADLNAIGFEGITPLIVACANENYEIATFLIDNGANPYFPQFNGFTAFNFIESFDKKSAFKSKFTKFLNNNNKFCNSNNVASIEEYLQWLIKQFEHHNLPKYNVESKIQLLDIVNYFFENNKLSINKVIYNVFNNVIINLIIEVFNINDDKKLSLNAKTKSQLVITNDYINQLKDYISYFEFDKKYTNLKSLYIEILEFLHLKNHYKSSNKVVDIDVSFIDQLTTSLICKDYNVCKDKNFINEISGNLTEELIHLVGGNSYQY